MQLIKPRNSAAHALVRFRGGAHVKPKACEREKARKFISEEVNHYVKTKGKNAHD